MRPYTTYFEYAIQQGFKPWQQEEEQRTVAHLVLTINTTLCSLRSCASSLDLAVLASSLGELTSERLIIASRDCHRTVKGASSICGRRPQ